MFESCLRNYKWSKFLYTKGLRPLIVYGRCGKSDGTPDIPLVFLKAHPINLGGNFLILQKIYIFVP